MHVPQALASSTCVLLCGPVIALGHSAACRPVIAGGHAAARRSATIERKGKRPRHVLGQLASKVHGAQAMSRVSSRPASKKRVAQPRTSKRTRESCAMPFAPRGRE